jgi:hypothetical protein
MEPATRALLSTFFKPFNRQLYQLINEDFDWN